MVVVEQEINELKRRLLARQKKLANLIRPMSVSVDNKSIKSIDQQAQLEWSQINKALARIDNGTYGTCVVCGVDIDHQRLKAYPHSAFCRTCVNP